VVLAKAPVPGLAKTRLSPPLRPVQAAALAHAALSDTLAAVVATRAARRVLVLEGEPGEWMPDGLELLPQRRGDLPARLTDAFADVGEAALLIGMDTPQVTPALLSESLERLAADEHDAVLGLTPDGGYWAIGLKRPDRRVFLDVPMSTAHTGAIQRRRLSELMLRTGALPLLRDVDRYPDAVAVAAVAPTTRFARALEAIGHDPLKVAV